MFVIVRRKYGSPKPGAPQGLAAGFEIIVIPRARKVHQSLLTTPPTAVFSLLRAWTTLFPTGLQPFAEVLLLNGPGTCCILCIVVYLFRVRSRTHTLGTI